MPYGESDGNIVLDKETEKICFTPPHDPLLPKKIEAYQKLTKKLGGILFISRYRSTAVHLLGGWNASLDSSAGVCNHKGQVLNQKLLPLCTQASICDASLIPCSVGINPCLTIATVAEHVSRHLVQDVLDYKSKRDRNFEILTVEQDPCLDADKNVDNDHNATVLFKETMRGYVKNPLGLKGEKQLNPVLLLNGHSTESYRLPTEPRDLIRTLLEEGHEIWLLQPRLHPMNPVNSFTIEDIGKYDIPATINMILELHGPSARIHVAAHCVGGLSIHIALMGGHVSATHIASLSFTNSSMIFKLTTLARFKMWLPLVPVSMSILGKKKILPLLETSDKFSAQALEIHCLLHTKMREMHLQGINFCIIEGPETVQDFVQMQLQEIQDNIKSRRNKIFLLMEEVRRLRVQQRIKSVKVIDENVKEEEREEADEMPDIPSSIPFLPRVTSKTLKQLYLTSLSFVSGIIVFGGLIAPTLELKLGLGGTSYEDFIRSMHLPMQLSQVDPIVASFSGGAVGVISALMLIEANNVEQQEKKRCKYCHGTGYLACARCSSSGVCLGIDPVSLSSASNRPCKYQKLKGNVPYMPVHWDVDGK
ncbi:hypothetical protein GH714_030596 [Hevea brasiliensis]|uniref:Glucose-methanol-choline oxidoreductase C-terminal domain-containing protein n=1 Tax=Hevea brasiliensis TaxID=3981 RepID=A0A6A6M1S1_HEVBR|nr:hypothetical protein GH714_030596 [Hevea brasiliensis]